MRKRRNSKYNLLELDVGVAERDFTNQLIELAKALDWHIYHVPDSRGVSARGFPDCVLQRGTELIVAELKVKNRQPTEHQVRWLNAFAANGIPAYTWRPTDYEDIKTLLGVNNREFM